MHFERWREIAAAAVIVSATGSPAAARDRDCALETRLEWIDVFALAPFAYREMASEAERILVDHAVCASIKRAAPSSVREKGEIAVILLRSMGETGARHRVMGATRTRDTPVPTVWIFYDEVASALGLLGREPPTWTAVERHQFGGALGRIAAHEVMHALLPRRPHDAFGLMTATLGRKQLTSPSVPTHADLVADVRRAATAGTAATRSWAAAR